MLISYLKNLNPYQELIKFDQLLADIPADLAKNETWQELQLRAALAVKYSHVGPAYKLLKRLQSQLFKQNQEIKDRYEPVMVWLQYAAMPDLSLGELVDFFQHYNFTIILNDGDFNALVEMLRLRLSLEDINDRDGWREKIYNALHQNEKLITEFSGAFGRKTTVANWLKLYDAAIGLEPAESIKVAEFNNQNFIALKLDEESKALWKRLVDFYEYLKLSSSDPLGFEEDVIVTADGNNYLLSKGEQVDLARVESEMKPILGVNIGVEQKRETKAASAIASPSLLEFGQIINQARAVLSETNGEVKQILNKLEAALGTRSVNQSLGVLLLLAQLRRLDDVLAEDERFRALVQEDLKKQGQDAMLEGFRLNPTAPNFLARFLKIVLQEKLGLSEGDALGFIQKLIPVLALEGEKYGRIVVEDGKGGLKWNL